MVGRKIGLTSPAVQQQLGVDQPDFGVLFADMDVTDLDRRCPRERLLQPKVEAEIAFVLGPDLDAETSTVEQVRAAVDYAVAALEIVDSRVADWDITIADTVADNASSGLFVLGEHRVTLATFEPREVTMQMYADDHAGLRGRRHAPAWATPSTRCPGWPAPPRVRDPLRAGQVMLSGALGPMVPAPPGTTVSAPTISRLRRGVRDVLTPRSPRTKDDARPRWPSSAPATSAPT